MKAPPFCNIAWKPFLHYKSIRCQVKISDKGSKRRCGTHSPKASRPALKARAIVLDGLYQAPDAILRFKDGNIETISMLFLQKPGQREARNTRSQNRYFFHH